ncbi:MAG: DNA polymerase III subunit delta' [Acidobacteriota bacterium]|nr:DNA polymerase III subunit delta' [Acidobacteriota bacterium]MDQ3417450.1 DNA polymerase III subunit delta' [Acidobacteriota bacterium]
MPFREIAGHDHLKQLIARAALRGTLPPSLIFAGPSGVGKAMMALALAQFVNCLAPVGEDACGQCGSCRRITRGVHADVLRIEPGDTGSIKIEQVREAIDRAAYRPFEGRRRVVIIDQAEQMGVNAQDAILKTLEEPPNSSTFILVTDTPDTLLPTIRSRCQRLRFGRLSPGDVAAVLIGRHEYAEADAHAAASLSDGSVGKALEGGSEDFVGARMAALHLLETVADDPPPGRRIMGAMSLPGATKGKADRDALGQSLRALASILRDLAALGAQADERAIANADLRPKLQRLLRSFDNDRSLRAFAAVDRALNALDRNASPKIVADWLSFQI